MQFLFWSGLFLLAYTFAGYPVLLMLLLFLRGKKCQHDEDVPLDQVDEMPSVSIVMVAYNEAEKIASRIANLEECKYEGERELILVCDGCTDETEEIATAHAGSLQVRTFIQESRQGKAGGVNRGVKEAKGEIIVFADCRQRFASDALDRLITPFLEDEKVAAVSGNLEIEKTEEGAGAGIDTYWKLERKIRHLESRWDSVIGCTGAIYAIRRERYDSIPVDTIIDDVVIPMQSLVKGNRIVFASDAVAFDPQSLNPEQEARRKVRTLAGNYQMLFRYPDWVNPIRNRCWWQLISHKYLRLAGPLLLLSCFFASGILAGDHWFFCIAFGGQIFCYGLAVMGLLLKQARSRLFTIPAGFLFLQWQCIRGLGYYLQRRNSSQGGVWS